MHTLQSFETDLRSQNVLLILRIIQAIMSIISHYSEGIVNDHNENRLGQRAPTALTLAHDLLMMVAASVQGRAPRTSRIDDISWHTFRAYSGRRITCPHAKGRGV